MSDINGQMRGIKDWLEQDRNGTAGFGPYCVLVVVGLSMGHVQLQMKSTDVKRS